MADFAAYVLTLWAAPAGCVDAITPLIPAPPTAPEPAFWVHLADALIHACDPAAGEPAGIYGESLIASVAEDSHFAEWCEAACLALPPVTA